MGIQATSSLAASSSAATTYLSPADSNSLVSLKLRGWRGSPVRLAEVLESRAGITALDLSKGELCIDCFSVIEQAANRGLKYLKLSKNDRPIDVSIIGRTLATNSTVTSLNLSTNFVFDVSPLADGLTSNNALTSLDLSCCCLSDVSSLGIALATNNTLTSLDLSDNHELTDVSSLGGALTINTALTSLDLSRCELTSVSSLAEALRVNGSLTFLKTEFMEGPDAVLIESLIERNICNHESKVTLQMLCARTLVREVFNHHTSERVQKDVYEDIARAFGMPEMDTQFGKDNAFRNWSKFALAARSSGFGVGSMAITHYGLGQIERLARVVALIKTTFDPSPPRSDF